MSTMKAGILRISIGEGHECDGACNWGKLHHVAAWRDPGVHGDPPPPPDYSTPAKVTARCRERKWARFRTVASKMKCPVADMHKPRFTLAHFTKAKASAEKESP